MLATQVDKNDLQFFPTFSKLTDLTSYQPKIASWPCLLTFYACYSSVYNIYIYIYVTRFAKSGIIRAIINIQMKPHIYFIIYICK